METGANLEVVRSMYAGFGDLAGGNADFAAYVDAHYVAECEYMPVEEGTAIVGREAMIGWNERWFEAWEELTADASVLEDLGDTVVTEVAVSARGAGSGMEIDQRFFHVIDLRGGKIQRIREFLGRQEALEAAGSPEQA
jgi:ketosteroid isomerase-like protein